MSKRIVLFELNEVPWRVLEDHIAERPAGALARLIARSHAFETGAEEKALSPWITWPSLHRGVGEDRHTITDFNQDLREINGAYPSLWELLAKAGVPVGVCGSVHSNPCPADTSGYSFYLPDPFALDSRSHPRELEAFQAFNLAMSRKSARNVSAGISWDKVRGMLASAPSIGLRTQTFAHLARQLVDERLRKWTKARRRTYQSLLSFDVFMRQLQNTRPVFSTFFTNHVASAMHRFWAARYPSDYREFGCSPEWISTYRNEVRWAMLRADDMLERLDRFAQRNQDYEIWVASSMGQAATEAQRANSQVYLRDLSVFLRRLGVQEGTWHERPAMAPRVVFALDGGRSTELERQLARIEIADRGALGWEHLGSGVYRIHPGVQKDVIKGQILLEGRAYPFAEFGFQNLLLEDQVGQTAYHIAEGILLCPSSSSSRAPRRSSLSTLEIAPWILAQLGVARPAYMQRSPGQPRVAAA